jgi:hypothetical protein
VAIATIVMQDDQYGETDVWETPRRLLVRMHSAYQGRGLRTWSVFLHGPKSEPTRREFGGPLVPGTYAFFVCHPSVISAKKDTTPYTFVDVEIGDTLDLECWSQGSIVQALTFEVREDSRHANPTLVPVTS